MKLKKIVSLALAGVLAVSMLAGCKSTGAADSSASSEAPVATGMVGKVIAALNEDVTDKVTFTAGSELQATMNVVVKNAADSALTSTVTATNLVTMNPSLGKDGSQTATQLPVIETTTDAATPYTDKVAQTSVFVVSATGTDETVVAGKLAAAIAGVDVYDSSSSVTIAKLPDCSNKDGKSNYRYDFKYTGNMAVVSSTDATTGTTTYVLAFTVTRTPSQYKFSSVTAEG